MEGESAMLGEVVWKSFELICRAREGRLSARQRRPLLSSCAWWQLWVKTQDWESWPAVPSGHLCGPMPRIQPSCGKFFMSNACTWVMWLTALPSSKSRKSWLRDNYSQKNVMGYLSLFTLPNECRTKRFILTYFRLRKWWNLKFLSGWPF